ncbi:NAD-dependent dehydratase [Alkalilimnicola ehrlichii]|uniref:NAD-dependent dehydratase n=1 Tax=Alkalilimnicola ehrlichii TaxID=351052 RepID=A0A3E0WWY1_9GAMM|nr:SDR family oxidoreductase [Alkalilimnicola ehrlichii]RFA29376.1 NAD-dependent dehydratase [Alkalilimnicola ehrlichii]RFA36889.1 NAD-dependent dehydratase [Alkalilimnicola ehrlichii]
MARIVIIGGHGKIALRLARRLVGAGHEVSALIRNPDHRDEVAATGAKPLLADLETSDTDTLINHLIGHDAVVWSAGAGGGNPPRTYAVDRDAAIRSMNAARQAGIDRYVMVSYLGAGPEHGVPPDHPFFPYAEAKAAADQHLRASKLAWTILGPGKLTDTAGSGKITLMPNSRPGLADTSRDNVAEVAAAVLQADNTIGRTIEFVDGDTPIATAVQTL